MRNLRDIPRKKEVSYGGLLYNPSADPFKASQKLKSAGVRTLKQAYRFFGLELPQQHRNLSLTDYARIEPERFNGLFYWVVYKEKRPNESMRNIPTFETWVFLNESVSIDWKRLGNGGYEHSKEDSGAILAFNLNSENRLHLTVKVGNRPENWKRYYWHLPIGRPQAAEVVRTTALDNVEWSGSGWEPYGGGRKDLVARWESGRGKYWVELYHEGSISYSYRSNSGSGGSLLADDDATAVRYMEHRAVTDQPSRDHSRAPSKMKRTR